MNPESGTLNGGLLQVFDSGITLIIWLQQFSPTMDPIFKALTFLGDETFFLLSLPCIYWCLNKKIGARLSVLFLSSAYINMVAKCLADLPRPFDYSPSIQPLVEATGGGFPSGHTQGAVVFWGYLAYCYPNTFFRCLAGFLILGIPFSRVYLGVHFPIDLIGGYLIGMLLVYAFIKGESLFARWKETLGFTGLLVAASCLPALLALLFSANKTAVAAMAALAGLGVGFVLEERYLGFRTARTYGRKGAGFFAGMAVFALIYIGLKEFFTGLEPVALFRFIRYSLVGLWGGVGAPWLFLRLKWSAYESNR